MAASGARSVATVLSWHHAGLAESDVAEALDEGYATGLLHPVAEPAASLAGGTRAFLDTHGGIPSGGADMVRRSRARTAALVATELSTALTTEQAAARLKVDPSRIRHRARDGALYALPAREGRSHRFAAWQFAGSAVLPHLKEILAALPDGLHPAEVSGFITTPADTLDVDGQPVSPRVWLTSGGDPAPVVELAAAMRVMA